MSCYFTLVSFRLPQKKKQYPFNTLVLKGYWPVIYVNNKWVLMCCIYVCMYMYILIEHEVPFTHVATVDHLFNETKTV